MNRSIRAFFIIAVCFALFISGCENEAIPDIGNPDTTNPDIGFPYAGSTYLGETGAFGEETAFIYAWDGISVSAPVKRVINADGYFTIDGTITASEPEFALALIIVSKSGSTDESTRYWVGGDFSQKIWLRFGPGEYIVQLLRAEITGTNLNYEGAISSYSFWSPSAYEFEVTNTRDEDGRYLYPSYYSQSDTAVIHQKAADLTSGESSDIERARVIHDYIVKKVAYDFESLPDGARKKQDAVTVFSNDLAVCDGYTTLYAAMLRSIGIETAYCAGTANGGSHAWNDVLSSGEWNYVDVTWDDPILGADGHSNYPDGDNLRYDYFWKPDFSDHLLDQKMTSKTVQPVQGGLMPGWY